MSVMSLQNQSKPPWGLATLTHTHRLRFLSLLSTFPYADHNNICLLIKLQTMLDPWGPLEKRFIKTWIWPSAAGWDNQWLPCVQSMHILPNLICCFNFFPSYICAYMTLYNILFCFGVYLPVLPKILELLASSNEHSMFFSSYSYVILLSCFNWWIMIVVQNSFQDKDWSVSPPLYFLHL